MDRLYDGVGDGEGIGRSGRALSGSDRMLVALLVQLDCVNNADDAEDDVPSATIAELTGGRESLE